MMLLMFRSLECYLESKAGLWAPSSINTARSKLRTVLLFSEQLDPRTIFTSLKHSNYSLYTIKTYLILAAGYERWSRRTHVISDFLKENAATFRNAYQEKTTRMEDFEYVSILASVPNNAIHNLITLLGQCGLRKSEALAAKWTDLDSRTNCLKVIGKGGKLRYVPLLPSWLKPVAVGAELICGPSVGFQGFINKSGFTYHDFRAYYATKTSKHPELSLKDVQMLLGHNSIETTQRYVRVDFERVKKVLVGS